MAHPWINREVKCAFRWYRSASLRHRNRSTANEKDTPDECVQALVFPAYTILPFQALLTTADSPVDSWLMKNLDGTTAVDLASSIPLLAMEAYANPDRAILCLEEPLVLTTLPAGKYEMEIATEDGETVYSETFEILSACDEESLDGSDEPGGSSEWTFGTWLGRLAGVVQANGDLPTEDIETDAQYLVLGDDLIYTWNGSSFDAAAPSSGSYWAVSPGSTWYRYNGSVFVIDGTGPIVFGGSGACWQGVSDVPLIYELPEGAAPGFLRIRFTLFFGSPITGSLQLWVGGTMVGSYGQADNGTEQEVVVLAGEGEDIEWIPTGSFEGCLQQTEFFSLRDGTACMTRLDWSHCGDLGTVAYTIGNGNFTNTLYLREGGCSMHGAIGDPQPSITEEVEKDAQGETTATHLRKEVEWRLELGNLPWHVLDALGEMVVSGNRSIRAPWGDDSDDLVSMRMEVSWQNKNRVADGAVVFRVAEATAGSGCCGLFERACAEPCEEAVGVYGVDELLVGSRYLYLDGRIGEYCGDPCEDVADENFFTAITACPSRMATTTDPLRPYMRWDGGEWVPAVTIDEVEEANEECTLVNVTATIQSGYMGRIDMSIDGEDWEQAGPVFTASELAAGVTVEVLEGAMFLRVVAMGHECDHAFSAAAPVPCACPFIVWSSNIDELCASLPQDITILAQPYASDSGAGLAMVALGEQVAIDWRLNGGSWTEADVQTTGEFYVITGVPYTTEGDIIEARIRFTDRPWCDDQTSDEFSCPE